jgi:glycosyltransferase involved in cell wall biosynthesis
MIQASPKTILYVITRAELGGAQGNVLDLMAKFAQDYHVHLAIGNQGPLTEDAQALGVPVHLIPSMVRSIDLVKDLRAVRELNVLIAQIRPNLIHAHSSKAGVIARVSGRLCQIPTIFTAHGWGFSPGTPRLRGQVALLTERLLASQTARIICVSESDRQQALQKHVGTENTLVTIRYGICNSDVIAAQPEKEPPRLIMVARFSEQKDQLTLLRAIAGLSDLSFTLDLVGSGPNLETCQRLAAELGLEKRVQFLGDRRDVPDLLAQSQIYILSTNYEGLPISILEAMRHGLPVVASDVNGIPEEVEHEQTGIIVPPQNNVEALSHALRRLIESPNLRSKMGQLSRQKFEREFTITRMIDQTWALYKELL